MRCLAALILSGCCSAVSLAGDRPPPPALAEGTPVAVRSVTALPTAAEQAARAAELQDRITQRAAKEARDRQARIAARRSAGISLMRPVYGPDLGLLADPHLWHVDPGVPALRVPGTVAAGLVPLPTPHTR